MPESRIRAAIEELFKEFGENVVEERVADYIIKELREGRQLSDILNDTYVKNHVSGDHLTHVLENKKLLKAFEDSVKQGFPAFE